MVNVLESEYSLIGSLFLMAEAKPINELYSIAARVDESDFSDQLCATVYRHIKASILADKPFDVVTIYDDMQASRVPGPEIKPTEIGGIVMRQPGFAAIESHVAKVLDNSLRRKSLAAVGKLYEQLQTAENTMQALGMAESSIQVLLQKANGETSGMTHISEHLPHWMDQADRQYKGEAVEVGFTTGFLATDEMIGEKLLEPGSLMVIGANPGKGKTALMVRQSIAIAEQYPSRIVHVYSLEMPSAQIVERVMAQPVHNKKVRFFNDDDWTKISVQMCKLQQTNLFICDDPVISVEQIKANARAEIAKGNRIGAIFVDYLTLMKLPKAERHDLSVGEVTKQCKRLAKELGCLVVLLAQLSRSNMQRVNKRPINSDLRDSGNIEMDADYIVFPYYDYYFDKESNCGPFAELIFGKNRHGASETTYCKVINGVWLDCDQQEARARLAE